MAITAVADSSAYNRVVDANTMNNWTKYFDLNNLDTSNAGGVWTDKTVLSDASVFDGKVTMADPDKNFLTTLSAIAANKEVVGYSTIPTDTVLVLDLSGSMNQDEGALVNSANSAIAKLLGENNNNRIGVVAYSAAGETGSSTYEESVTQLLPLGRYTTRNNIFLNASNNTVSVNQNVREQGVANAPQIRASKYVSGGTYIQSGLWEAYEMFMAVPDEDIVIGPNNWQSGDYRMPIVVLMSDGAPTTGTTYFDNVDESYYTYTRNNGRTETVYASNVGNGNDNGMTAGQGFLVQLTASYIKNRIENHYKVKGENGAGRSLFYTLGFNISADNNPNSVSAGDIAYSVLNPDDSTITDSLWTTYNDGNETMQVNVKNRNGGNSNMTLNKNSYVTNKSYVDGYFPAEGAGLTNAFNSIIEEIILQSRYYPTHLEGGSPDFSGYVEFTDTLGEYMEVKHVNGILLGDTLFDGHMMASKLTSNSADGLGTVENPTALGDEFIRAVKTRLGIAETAEAQALVAKAFADGQLRYNGENDWSNYIAWYAKADGTYAGFYDEDGTAPVPSDAVYVNRSFGFLGETTGSIKNSDMMYMSVQLHTNIETGEQSVIWKIPAALVPMVTYKVSLTGTNVDVADDVSLSVEDADNVAPIRLIYETGLRSDLNEFNITRITDAEHVAADGHTRLFWNNYFDISAPTHDEHITAMSEFTPNKENERFYYTFDSAVFKADGNSYALVGQNETLADNGEYYHRRYVFREGNSRPVFFYERMSSASIKAARDNGWQANFETLDHQTVGAWVVPEGTPARELQMYDEEKAANLTNSANMIFHPYITESNNLVAVDMNLGNNGLLAVTPETGLKISKTVDIFEPGTSDQFRFRLSTSASGSINYWVTNLDETPSGDPQTANLTNGAFEFDLSKDHTLWVTGLPAGTDYVVEEISDNADYKVKSVHVNGESTGVMASDTIAQYYIEDIDFVNTAVSEGDLVITKQVVDNGGNPVDINENVKFTAEVTLTNAAGAPVSGTFNSTQGSFTVPANGKFSITLSEGESFVLRGLREETRYTVAETAIPAGFALNVQASSLSGTVDASANDRALIVNTYNPTPTDGTNVAVKVLKEISGARENWLPGESYTFNLERLDFARATGTPIASATIDYNDNDKSYLFSLSSEDYTEAGTYYYRITEEAGTQGGVTYDTAERRFIVNVADTDMDGDLEIISVENQIGTTVDGAWLVTASFNNVYAPAGSAAVSVNVQKQMNGAHPLSGYRFALYDADPTVTDNASVVTTSPLTDASGLATITLNYSATHVGRTYTYYLVEENRGQIINNIRYSSAIYKVDVAVVDNLDGTISASAVISDSNGSVTVPTFTNEYVPSSSDYITLSGRKNINGDRRLNAGEFSFTLSALTPSAPMPAALTVKNAADGSFSFPAIEFTDSHKGNTYTYVISEDSASPIGGFSYDTTEYYVYVSVVDNGDQTLTARIDSINANNVSAVSDIVFINSYDATDAEVVLTATKILTGKTMQNGEFSFEITPVTPGAPMPVNAVAANDANGNITFRKIVFPKAGTYVYEIAEIDGGISNYDYDESVYTATVTVTDNSQGKLSAAVRLLKNNMPSSEIVFRNGFVPTPITYTDLHIDFGGTKVLYGRPLEAGEFEFALINAINGQQIGETVRNTQSSAFFFPEITLASAGIHHFKIVEVVGDEKGVAYDNTSFHVRLEVTQDDSGVLSIVDKQLHKGTVTKQEIGGVLTEVTEYTDITLLEKIEFNNSYKADPVYVVLEAAKTLTGRDLVDGEFKFDLHKTASDYAFDETTLYQNDVTLTLKDDGTGGIEFMPERYDTAGTYYYVIVEDEVDEKGVTSDKSVYKVEVTVTDDRDGNLVATLKVNGQNVNGSTADSIKFENAYDAAATEIKISGRKTLEGRDLIADEFSFELYDKDGKKLETVKNAADGNFSFTAIPVDAEGEYVYTVRETAGNAENVTYDTAVYTVTATVTDNLDGTFKVEYTYKKGTENANGVTFLNVYTVPTPPPTPAPNPEIPQTGDSSNLALWVALLFVCGGGFIATTLYGRRKEEEQN